VGWRLAVCGSFLLLYLGPMKAQKDGEMMSCWADLLPGLVASLECPCLDLDFDGAVSATVCLPLGEA